MITKTTIFNDTLIALKIATVGNADGDASNNEALAVLQYLWKTRLPSFAEQNIFRFWTKRRALALKGELTDLTLALPGHTYAYAYPSDAIQVRAVVDLNTISSNRWYYAVDNLHLGYPYDIEVIDWGTGNEKCIVTSLVDAGVVLTIDPSTAIPFMTSTAANAISYFLALAALPTIGSKVTSSKGKVEALIYLEKETLIAAKALDAAERNASPERGAHAEPRYGLLDARRQ